MYSRHATAVTLLLFGEDAGEPVRTIGLEPLTNRTGPVWHARVATDGVSRYYAYRVDGPRGPGHHRHAFDPEKVLLDPMARAIHFPKAFDRRAAIGRGSNMGRAPLGVLPRLDGRDPAPPRRLARRHEHDLVIYELHVRGFTVHPSSGVVAARRGTYAGVIDKIPYLKGLGVTAVELMPVFQFDPQEGNYWGYMPMSFFAPHAGYAAGGGASAEEEFAAMVDALHAAGIEVLVDAVHNHTVEGDERHPTYSLKGIDACEYYVMGDDPADPYADFSGCGNALNASSGAARGLVIESLRHWVERLGVDGFRHDLASVLARRGDGSIDPSPPLLGALRAVREVGRARHIVEPWDAAGAYLLGTAFPHEGVWQWNDRFRDDLRRFVRGDAGMIPNVIRRLYGSDDLFPDAPPHFGRPCRSVNYVSCHDGFTLYDLLSYTQRRNHANGHNNQDGHPGEVSTNCGHEGDEGAGPEVLERRARRARALVALLLLSNGTPMLRAGDEFLQTQGGNNNPYNQDNETTWLDWKRAERFAGHAEFVRRMIAFRAAHPSIARHGFWRDDVRWFGPEGPVHWDARRLAYALWGAAEGDEDLFVAINMEPAGAEFRVMAPGAWRHAIDSSRDGSAAFFDGSGPILDGSRTLHVPGESVVVLVGTAARLPAPLSGT